MPTRISIFLIPCLLAILLAACGGVVAAPTATFTLPATAIPSISKTTVSITATNHPSTTITISHTPTTTSHTILTPTPYDWSPYAGCGLPDRSKTNLVWFLGFSGASADEQVKLGISFSWLIYGLYPIAICPKTMPWGIAKDVLQTELAAENPLDILGPIGLWDYNNIQSRFQPNLVLDLAPLIEKDNAGATLRDPQQYDQTLIDMRREKDGKLFSLPLAAYVPVFMFNTTLFDQAGLHYPPMMEGEKYSMPDGSQVPWDWETVATVARLLTLDGNGHNATQPGFDARHIKQYGFTWDFNDHPNYIGSAWQTGSLARFSNSGKYVAEIPAAWKTAWQWTYDGLHGQQPFIATEPEDYDKPRSFQSGESAMTLHGWWGNSIPATFQFAALPSYQGKVAGKISTMDFYIFKSSYHPNEAFSSIALMLEHANPEFLVGNVSTPPIYPGGIPTRLVDRQAYFDLQKQKYPSVTTWDVLLAGLSHTDGPNAEAYMPNFHKAWDRIQEFGMQIQTGGIDLIAEEAKLDEDLTAIFNQ